MSLITNDEITLDIKRNDYITVKAKQGDKNSRFVTIHITDNGQEFKLDEEMTAHIVVDKADGNIVADDCEIDFANNTVVVKLTVQMLMAVGQNKAEVTLVDSNDDRLITTMHFYILVDEVIAALSKIQSSDEYETLGNLILTEQERANAMTDLYYAADNAENIRIANENDRISAEDTRIVKENDRIAKENDRITAENNRIKAETQRISNENTRIEKEGSRVTSESQRVKDEATRVSSEITRGMLEKLRADQETIRKEAEDVRITSESERVTNENTRKENENLRINNESNRNNAERDRISAETARGNSENNRISAENTRKESENVRISNENNRITEMTALRDTVANLKDSMVAVRTYDDNIVTLNIQNTTTPATFTDVPIPTFASTVKVLSHDEESVTFSIPGTTERASVTTIPYVDGINDELVKRINPLSNPNLLTNGDFQVWQRGSTIVQNKTGTVTYGADRWSITSGTINKISGCVKITPESNTTSFLAQFLELDLTDKTVTLSYKYKGGNVNSISGTVNKTTRLSKSLSTMAYTVEWDSARSCYRVIFSFTAETSIEYIKLEYGDVVTPHYPKSYAEELAACQRWYYKWTVYKCGGYVSASNTKLFCEVQIPHALRTVNVKPKSSKINVRCVNGYSLLTPSDTNYSTVLPTIGLVSNTEVELSYYSGSSSALWCASAYNNTPILAVLYDLELDAEIY